MTLNAQDRDYFIRTIYGEAGGYAQSGGTVYAAGEPTAGKVGVAHVIKTRLDSGVYGDTIQSVVTAENQFEPWNDPKAKKRMEDLTKDSVTYQKIGEIVDGVMAGNLPDPSCGATNFCNVAVVKDRNGGTIGNHGWISDFMKNGKFVDIGRHTFMGNQVTQQNIDFDFDAALKTDSSRASRVNAQAGEISSRSTIEKTADYASDKANGTWKSIKRFGSEVTKDPKKAFGDLFRDMGENWLGLLLGGIGLFAIVKIVGSLFGGLGDMFGGGAKEAVDEVVKEAAAPVKEALEETKKAVGEQAAGFTQDIVSGFIPGATPNNAQRTTQIGG